MQTWHNFMWINTIHRYQWDFWIQYGILGHNTRFYVEKSGFLPKNLPFCAIFQTFWAFYSSKIVKIVYNFMWINKIHRYQWDFWTQYGILGHNTRFYVEKSGFLPKNVPFLPFLIGRWCHRKIIHSDWSKVM